MSQALSRRPLGRLALAFLVGLAILAFAAAPIMAEAPAPDKSTARFEVDFMADMIDHHAMAAMMAEMCVEKAIHEELISTCEQIIATQSQEIAMMQSWLQDWYGVSYAPEVKMDGMHRLMKLEGEEFEIAFMEMMIRHHRQAIKEGETCLDRGYHPELLGLCQNIIETQSAEIEQMQAWLCEWYGICRNYSEGA